MSESHSADGPFDDAQNAQRVAANAKRVERIKKLLDDIKEGARRAAKAQSRENGTAAVGAILDQGEIILLHEYLRSLVEYALQARQASKAHVDFIDRTLSGKDLNA